MRSVVALVVLLSGLVVVPAAVSAQTHPSSYDSPTPDDTGAESMADLVNAHRAANGLDALIFDVDFSDRTEPYALGLAAQFPAPDPLPGYAYTCPKVSSEGGFNHDDSRSIWASVPPGATYWGENIAYRCGTNFENNVNKAFEALVNSAGHNANMLGPTFTHLAVSVIHYGNSTFVVQRFATVPGGEPVVVTKPPGVRSVASCLAGKGRIDTYVTNPNASATSYSVRVTGTRGFSTTRALDVGANQTKRVTITGRYDGVHDIAVRPKADPGAAPVTASVTIDCATGDANRPIVVTNSCLSSNGRIDVYVGNTTTAQHLYVVDIESGEVRDRSLTLAPGAKGRVTVTGRPDGDIPISVRMDGALIHRAQVTVDCDK